MNIQKRLTFTAAFFSVVFLVVFFATPSRPQGAIQTYRVNYDLWASVLKKYVNDEGRVNYKILKKDQRELNAFINQIENVAVERLSSIEQKAFWINAYNALTLKVVADKYPVKSIRYINFGLVWELDRAVARVKKSLGDIEHKVLRPLGDPRIHFAINCASIGCPSLPNEPFYAETLDERLTHETKRFINDPQKVRLDREGKTLFYSAIFDWFEEDFLKEAPDIKTYIMKYINQEDLKFLVENDVKMKALSYDWGLNEQ